MANILAIDDDLEILAVIKKALEKEGHMVAVAVIWKSCSRQNWYPVI